MPPILQKPEKAKYRNALTVAIDPQNSTFDFYIMENGDKSTVAHEKKEYVSRLFSAEFLNELTSAAKDYAASHSSAVSDACITLVLPDSVVAMDTLTLPTMKKKRIEEALEATLVGTYKNRSDLSINNVFAVQNKQIAMYSLTMADTKLLKAVASALKDGNLAPNIITFAANATVNAITQLNPKLKNASYLLLDLKHRYCRVVFVAKGRPTGFYSLPFGYSILRKSKLYPEELLFDHPTAELAVLNAHEKAKAKQLTGMVTEEMNDNEQLDARFGEDEDATSDPTAQNGAPETIKVLPKKQPRKLPKFMIRPTPRDDEGYHYENFRLFIKWALLLLQGNDKLTSQGEPEKVFVNLPGELGYLFEMTNEEAEENGIEFQPLEIHGDRDEITDCLELYGGLFANQYNKNNNFR